MGFYLRKSLSFGPLRLNLSRSGLGMSVGVTGARVGAGPRGSYVHLGRGGIYYRQSLGSPSRGHLRQPTPLVEPTIVEIETKPTTNMRDGSPAGLLEELNRVQSRVALTPLAFLAAILLIAAATAIAMRMADVDRSSSHRLLLASPADAISSAEILRERHTRIIARAQQLSAEHDATLMRWRYLLFGVAIIFGITLILSARHRDVIQGTAILAYDLEANAKEWFSHLLAAFAEFASCERVWHIRARGPTGDWKRHAGATTLVTRQAVIPSLSLPRRVECNLRVPSLKAGTQMLYFFPDRLLVYEGRGVGAVTYSDLEVSSSDTQFREEGAAPSDAEKTGMTWRYVNRSGGPDRRFNNNTQIPIMRYGDLHFTSPTGLNELFQCSRPETGRQFASALKDFLR